jgi:NAD(P)-dependent dehydrogenase (short-subunit alcohol dehydrogenase family)
MFTPEINALRGRVAFVTGATSGIGRAAALHLARAGCHVALIGRTESELKAVVTEIEAVDGVALECAVDVNDGPALQRAVSRIEKTWGRIDIVVANAGINGVWCPLEELDPKEWDETLDTNLRGAFLTLKSTLPLLKRSGGSIIVIASVNGTRMFSNTGATAYAVSNAGRVALAKMLALELAKDRIRVNAICPGSITTNIEDSTERRHLAGLRAPVNFPEGGVPLTGGRPGDPKDVADLILFLACDASSHITGSTVFIDGGESLLHG